MKKALKEIENKEKLSRAIASLDSTIRDTQGKKKMKNAVAEVISMLKDEDSSMPVRAANAVSSLEDVTREPWLESHTRTAIWQAISVLETVKD